MGMVGMAGPGAAAAAAAGVGAMRGAVPMAMHPGAMAGAAGQPVQLVSLPGQHMLVASMPGDAARAMPGQVSGSQPVALATGPAGPGAVPVQVSLPVQPGRGPVMATQAQVQAHAQAQAQ